VALHRDLIRDRFSFESGPPHCTAATTLSFEPFDNSDGFLFPAAEGLILSDKDQLLVAPAFIPPTERVEAAGFVFPGDNFAIRDEVIRRINAVSGYKKLFGKIFNRPLL
jgi:hypothetical protein